MKHGRRKPSPDDPAFKLYYDLAPKELVYINAKEQELVQTGEGCDEAINRIMPIYVKRRFETPKPAGNRGSDVGRLRDDENRLRRSLGRKEVPGPKKPEDSPF